MNGEYYNGGFSGGNSVGGGGFNPGHNGGNFIHFIFQEIFLQMKIEFHTYIEKKRYQLFISKPMYNMAKKIFYEYTNDTSYFHICIISFFGKKLDSFGDMSPIRGGGVRPPSRSKKHFFSGEM